MQIRAVAWVIALLAAMAPVSCTTGPSRPDSAPDSAVPGVLALTATDFIDTDSNKYRDTSTVVIYVFAESAQYKLPMKAEGTFEFVLEDRGGRALAPPAPGTSSRSACSSSARIAWMCPRPSSSLRSSLTTAAARSGPAHSPPFSWAPWAVPAASPEIPGRPQPPKLWPAFDPPLARSEPVGPGSPR